MIRVALADDHPILRKGIRAELQAAGIEVIGEASDGESAVLLATRLQPDALLLDIEMPGLNGIEVTRRIRESAKDLPILILSAYDCSNYVFGLLAAGITGYVLKDEAPETIVMAVHAAVRGESWLSPRVTQKLMRRVLDQEQTPASGLTPRETEVVRLIAAGYDNHTIAQELCLSERTVKFHVGNIYSKLGVTSRAEAVLWAMREGLATVDK